MVARIRRVTVGRQRRKEPLSDLLTDCVRNIVGTQKAF